LYSPTSAAAAAAAAAVELADIVDEHLLAVEVLTLEEIVRGLAVQVEFESTL
jgi:cobalamin biosynthesis protein CbiD